MRRLAADGASLILHGRDQRKLDDIAAEIRDTPAASDPTLAGVTGRFFDRTREARAHRQAYDPGARKELWNRGLQLTGAVADQGQ